MARKPLSRVLQEGGRGTRRLRDVSQEETWEVVEPERP